MRCLLLWAIGRLLALTDDLVGYWPLNEASGNALDAFGTNPLTETNGAIGVATGVIDNARDIEADTTQYFNHASNATLQTGDIDFTFQIWVKAETLVGFPMIAHKGWKPVTDAGSEWTIYYNSSISKFAFEKAIGGTLIGVGVLLPLTPVVGVWYLIHVWHDSVNDQIGISVNASDPDINITATGVNAGTDAFQIGGSSAYGLWFDGLVCEAALWKRVLTPQERTLLYNNGAGLSFSVITASAALTGTAVSSTETDIVTGGKTIILTLTGDTFTPA